MAQRSLSTSSNFSRQGSYDNGLDEIQNLVNIHERGGKLDHSAYQHVEITKAHWKKVSEATNCANNACKKKLRFERKRNCCMCGNVFCRPCTQSQRRLSHTAVPDPFGNLYPVCTSCHERDKQTIGLRRSHLDDYRYFRHRLYQINEVMQKEKEDVKADPLLYRYCRRVNYAKECSRLTEGFRSNSTFLKQTFTEITGKVPDWQKSSHWFRYDKKKACALCFKDFSVISRRIHCRVCSKLCCSGCVKEDLLIYINEDGMSKWGINGAVSFTAKPSRYCLLFTCSECKPELEQCLLEEQRLEEEREEVMEDLQQSDSFFEEFAPVQSKLWKMQCDISEWLPTFIDNVESFISANAMSKSVGLHNLAKVNIDLSDTFTKMSITSQKLRLMKPTTKAEAVVLKNCVTGTLLFYSENMFLFRQALRSLTDLAPTDILDMLQAIINETTIRNILTVCKSICFSLLHLQDSCGVHPAATKLLADTVASLDDDFRIALKQNKGGEYEDWIKDIDGLVHLEVKNNPRIRVPQSKSCKSVYKQCIAPLRSCRRELEAKTPKKEFEQTKNMLEILLEASSSPFIKKY